MCRFLWTHFFIFGAQKCDDLKNVSPIAYIAIEYRHKDVNLSRVVSSQLHGAVMPIMIVLCAVALIRGQDQKEKGASLKACSNFFL